MALGTAAPRKTPSPAQEFLNELQVPPAMAREQFHAMGTTISLLVPESQIERGTKVVRTLFASWEETLSRFLPGSELSYLNSHAGEPVTVSPLLFKVVHTAFVAAQETAGLFDPTLLRQIVELGYDRTFEEVPAISPVFASPARPGGGWLYIQMNREKRQITLPESIGIDLGGIAKGMAVDAAMDVLRELDIDVALVNAGGDLAVMGTLPDGDCWPLAVQGKDTYQVIPFLYGALATSGKAHRRWQQGKQERHHIIDPRSGESAQSGLWSVTVAAGRCEQAEVAAKVAFMLGEEQGKEFLVSHGLAGFIAREDGSWTTAGSWPVSVMKEMHEVQGISEQKRGRKL